uniref:Uncharacterized protein n=1 Tax=Myoviridae sp. ctBtT5 TaxID=2825048 RepID=A0A8S5PY51_9CAUD|nr:MAG TPA: hypothetical protein [Myoviridae sp. ctBtT5]
MNGKSKPYSTYCRSNRESTQKLTKSCMMRLRDYLFC